ncbi:NADPH-dependent FMN reductase [Legionella worsleiensis]|uniref:NADPH-dependent FMN reductase domain protein n=1 Tax=Legionella worsleiensis TaxID=45076 RepID=A0A0W1A617_9GAMM|nr:NAD(P)H-dependent oxidoreductase [Legionella worsleiensis]KTD76729.1 NADPH-dependent FMN reductase domain protein [Legionella worsleiensis]STY30515.1 NADPH-dependent FMN reductase domain protein [Legionella worsleiensis]
MLNIKVIVGSLRKESINRKLVLALDKLNHPNLNFKMVDVHQIPLYNQDIELNPPQSVIQLKKEIEEADGILIATPEYNRSIPGVLKNIIDWGSRPYGKNSWASKAVAVIGTSPGVIGTAVAQAHLRGILVGIDMFVLGHPELYITYKDDLIDNDLNFTNENTKNYLQQFLDTFSHWVEFHRIKS